MWSTLEFYQGKRLDRLLKFYHPVVYFLLLFMWISIIYSSEKMNFDTIRLLLNLTITPILLPIWSLLPAFQDVPFINRSLRRCWQSSFPFHFLKLSWVIQPKRHLHVSILSISNPLITMVFNSTPFNHFHDHILNLSVLHGCISEILIQTSNFLTFPFTDSSFLDSIIFCLSIAFFLYFPSLTTLS